MASHLEQIFGELGIAQYLDVFVDQGFDTWDTILDITESDLDALGVKLGHRRKLQRRIANTRGHAPEASLTSPSRLSVEDSRLDGRTDQPRTDASRAYTKDAGAVTKRKYRRHPKPDENAPERPPSAYVLFSNKMREDLKSQNLTFTEIAKLVGENWQSLSPGEKDVFESQATKAKEKYNHDLSLYKKTPEYRKYAQYLQDFKQKQASLNQAKDASKRLKLDGSRSHHGSGSHSGNGVTQARRPGSGTGSGSEREHGSEPPPTRRRRVNSTVSMADSHYHSSPAPTPGSQPMSVDELAPSPTGNGFPADPAHAVPATRSPPQPSRNGHNWEAGAMNIDDHSSVQRPSRASPGLAGPRALPSLSNMLQDSQRLGDASRPPFEGPELWPHGMNGHFQARDGPSPPLAGRSPPTLKHEPSTAGSGRTGSSTSSDFTYSRGSSGSDGVLPIRIDALLSTKSYFAPMTTPTTLASPEPKPAYVAAPYPAPPPLASGPPPPLHYRGGSMNGIHSPPSSALPHQRPAIAPLTNGAAPVASTTTDPGLDGMSALLKAGEIVDRRTH